ncbi:ChaN family lipoprotein [Vibrio sp. FNV 38]|nr:ChaN family lipoprotein [Vibrio sp. FNV 38]
MDNQISALKCPAQSIITTISLFLVGCTQSAELPIQPPTLSHFYDYTLVYNDTPIALETLPDDILKADVVLVGEWHTHSAIHRFQAELYHQLLLTNGKTTLSMEQFSRDKQALVDAYLKGDIGEQFLKHKANAWPNYESDYRALIELAKYHQQDVIAANAPRTIVHCVSKKGPEYLDSLAQKQRGWAARELDLSDNTYKQNFLTSMHHGDPSINKRQYAAQVTWDETMAESIVDYLKTSPDKQVMHIAGDFHVNQGLGIGRVIERLVPSLKVVTISPSSADDSASDYTFFVLPLPVRFVQKHHQMDAYKKMMGMNVTPINCEP